MAMDLSWDREAGMLIATLSGRIDSANSMDCYEKLKSGIGSSEQSLLLNMAGVTYLSSAGLRVLLMLARKFTDPEKIFAVTEVADHINEVINVSGFTRIIPVYRSRSEAVEAITDTTPTGDAGTPKQTAPPPELRNPLDMTVVGENITDVANYTVEKYEFLNAPLAREVRSEALSEISDFLWKKVEIAVERQKQIRAHLFQAAEATLEDVVARQSS